MATYVSSFERLAGTVRVEDVCEPANALMSYLGSRPLGLRCVKMPDGPILTS